MQAIKNISFLIVFIFDLFVIPNGINKENLITNICGELAELELLYPNYEVLRTLIGVWSNASLYKWDKLYKTTLLEYNPIENYDRTETRTLTSQASGSATAGGSDTTSASGSSSEKTAGFNSSPNSLVDKGSNETESEATTEYGRTNSETYNKADTENVRTHGNIGVTTTQQMTEQERNIANFNIYDIITNDFKQRFCLLVY